LPITELISSIIINFGTSIENNETDSTSTNEAGPTVRRHVLLISSLGPLASRLNLNPFEAWNLNIRNAFSPQTRPQNSLIVMGGGKNKNRAFSSVLKTKSDSASQAGILSTRWTISLVLECVRYIELLTLPLDGLRSGEICTGAVRRLLSHWHRA
jgi:hypothetical protein